MTLHAVTDDAAKVFGRPFRLSILLCGAAIAAAAALIGNAHAQSATPACTAPDEAQRLSTPLTRTGKRIAAGEPVRIVAIGSSSTFGEGASSPDNSYPSRLAIELKAMFPRLPIDVVNRGVNGEEAADMVARLDSNVLAEKPDLILWQVGANAVLRDNPIASVRTEILEGLRRMKAAGADVILMDPQFAPKVLAKKGAADMVDLLAATAKSQDVHLFQRFAVMRHWHKTAHIPFETFISPDELHMNDWSYGCVARLLAGAIAEAATRSTLTARAGAR